MPETLVEFDDMDSCRTENVIELKILDKFKVHQNVKFLEGRFSRKFKLSISFILEIFFNVYKV